MHNRLEFLEWLEEIMFLLPPNMSVHEARMLFERKIKEEKEILNGDDETKKDYCLGKPRANSVG